MMANCREWFQPLFFFAAMNKKRPNKPDPPADSSRAPAPPIPGQAPDRLTVRPTAQGNWSKRTKLICSALIAFHVLAVFVAPFSAPPPSSNLGRGLGDIFEPYLRLLCIYNGYRFFAPNPGPSHLVRFEIRTASGEQIKGVFPDRNQQWPRLLYHRYFMLSETLFQLDSTLPPDDVFAVQQMQLQSEIERLERAGHQQLADRLAKIKTEDAVSFQRYREQQKMLLNAIVTELKNRHDAAEVKLYLAERAIPLPLNIEETMADRRKAEGAQSPILLADETRWIEKQIYPELPGSTPMPIQTELLPNFPGEPDNSATFPFRTSPELNEQGRAGE
jgi:hypothetical protein